MEEWIFYLPQQEFGKSGGNAPVTESLLLLKCNARVGTTVLPAASLGSFMEAGMRMFILLLPALALLLGGCGNSTVPTEHDHKYLGSQCNVLTGALCNPAQLPMYSGEVFSPSWLFHAKADQITYDRTPHYDDDTQVSLSTTLYDQSIKNAKSFGLSPIVPYKGITFSGSLQYQHVASTMRSQESLNYYAEIARSYIVYTVYMSDVGRVNLSHSFASAVRGLPTHPMSEDDFTQWFMFFATYGTHYVKSVAFGGQMQLSVFLKSDVRNDESVNKTSWNFNLDAIRGSRAESDPRPPPGSFLETGMQKRHRTARACCWV